MKEFYIFGKGISFSMSPTIHTAGYHYHGLLHTYEILETEDVDGFAHLVQSPHFGGASVTMPHKLAGPDKAIRNNGPDNLAMERYKLRELAEGWPCYRDAWEWENLSSIFAPDAYIYTTWTGRTFYKDFIAASQRGMDRGAFTMHRCHGSTTDIDASATRAVTKMKATITQRFVLPGDIEVDAESDCRFCFFWEKIRSEEEEGKGEGEGGEKRWAARFVRHWYEKDKLIAVDPRRVPELDDDKLMTYPVGYRYLAYCQAATMGVKVMLDMPGHRREGHNANGRKHDVVLAV